MYEVPTHLEVQDRVLLGMTVPALMAASVAAALAFLLTGVLGVGLGGRLLAGLGAAGAVWLLTTPRLDGRPVPVYLADALLYRTGGPRRVSLTVERREEADEEA